MAVISWTRPMLERFKIAYQKAKMATGPDGNGVFKFDGSDFVLGYAKYLIEYLEDKLPREDANG
jgi:hypothetical protein